MHHYVGQTRNLRSRLGQDTQPSGTHNSATLAFLMAKEQAINRGLPVKGRTRAQLQADPQFALLFAQAKGKVATWEVRFNELEDPIIRTLCEVYVHVVLKTELNLFETH